MKITVKRNNGARLARLDRLFGRGFDLSYSRDVTSIHVACSQCEALVVNGER